MSGIEFLLDTNMVIGLLKGHASAQALAQQSGLKLGRRLSAKSPEWNCWAIRN